MKVLLLLAAAFVQATCTGQMKIRLKAQYTQDMTVLVSYADQPNVIALPIRLPANELKTLGPFPIDFTKNHSLTLMGAKTQELAIKGSTYIADFKPIRGTLSTKQLHLPLTGLELVFECDKNFAGDDCAKANSTDISSPKTSEDLKVRTDYSIDLDQLPKIVEKLKETTKVDNEIREGTPADRLKQRLEEEKERLEEKEKEKKKETDHYSKPLSTLFSTLLDSVLNFKDDFLKREKEGGFRSRAARPLFIDIEMPEEKEDPRDTIASSLLQNMSFRMEKSKEEDEPTKRKEGIERHRQGQEDVGMKHTVPSSFPSSFGRSFSPFSSFSSFGPLAGLLR